MITELESTLIHGFELCMRAILKWYSSFISLKSRIPIINTGRTNDGIPSPLKSGPWLVTMLFIIINASEMELARKNIQANEMKKKVTNQITQKEKVIVSKVLILSKLLKVIKL